MPKRLAPVERVAPLNLLQGIHSIFLAQANVEQNDIQTARCRKTNCLLASFGLTDNLYLGTANK